MIVFVELRENMHPLREVSCVRALRLRQRSWSAVTFMLQKQKIQPNTAYSILFLDKNGRCTETDTSAMKGICPNNYFNPHIIK